MPGRWIGEDNPVRVVDVFVEELDLAELPDQNCYASTLPAKRYDAPGADDYDWPDPEDYESDEDLDPLYDSTREYLEQIDSHKEFQGEEVESTYQTHICQNPSCGKEFQSARGHAQTCSALCRQQMNALLRRKNNAHLPKPDHVTYDRKCANPNCKKPFKAVQKNSTCCSTECRDALYAHERRMNRPKAAECKLKCKNPECGKPFTSTKRDAAGCSAAQAVRTIRRNPAP
jgi:hypothetical protein